MAAGALAGLLSCDGDTPPCVDLDFDGFGEGCPEPDCDDTNPLRNLRCDLVPPPDCGANPVLAGCPCLPGVAECYPADPATLAFGQCRTGRTLCVNGYWNICEGAVTPTFEYCDGTDQDCDGKIDEGVLSPCGGCTPGCVGGLWGEGSAPFAAGDGTTVTAEGWLTLARREQRSASVWLANSGEGTASKIDAGEASEVGRYFTGGREPSRVAVDWRNDAWVLNREFDGVSTLTKIAGAPERCVDRDGSDTLETSGGPEPRADDECVLFTVPVGEMSGVGRALAIDGDVGLDGRSGGDPWVGLHDEQAIVHLDGVSGEVLESVNTPGFSPYAAVFDPWGTLWMISRDGLLLSLDRFERPLQPVIREVPLACFLLYGLDADDAGNLVLTGFSCDHVTLYEPAADRWSTVPTPESVRGVVIVDDDEPIAWVAHTDGRASLLSLRPLALLRTLDLAGAGAMPLQSIGVGADSLGFFWAVSSRGGEDGRGVATRVDRTTGAVDAQVTVGLAPHTQGDLTGSKRAGGFVPEGTAAHVFTGCANGGTAWQQLHVAARANGGSLTVQARRADRLDELPTASFVTLGTLPDDPPPYPLAFDPGGVVEVRLVLAVTSRDGAPTVERIGLEWSCPGPD